MRTIMQKRRALDSSSSVVFLQRWYNNYVVVVLLLGFLSILLQQDHPIIFHSKRSSSSSSYVVPVFFVSGQITWNHPDNVDIDNIDIDLNFESSSSINNHDEIDDINVVSTQQQLQFVRRVPQGGSNHSTTMSSSSSSTSSSDSCTSAKSCDNCTALSKWYGGCHWCTNDQTCHAIGSYYGCTFGASSCQKINPNPNPIDPNNGTTPIINNNTCYSQTSCRDCSLYSHVCHWCAHDNSCHVIGSVSGCVTGVNCYNNERCQRKIPEILPPQTHSHSNSNHDGNTTTTTTKWEKIQEQIIDFLPHHVGMFPIIVVSILSSFILCCATLCCCITCGVKGAYDELADVASFNEASITQQQQYDEQQQHHHQNYPPPPQRGYRQLRLGGGRTNQLLLQQDDDDDDNDLTTPLLLPGPSPSSPLAATAPTETESVVAVLVVENEDNSKSVGSSNNDENIGTINVDTTSNTPNNNNNNVLATTSQTTTLTTAGSNDDDDQTEHQQQDQQQQALTTITSRTITTTTTVLRNNQNNQMIHESSSDPNHRIHFDHNPQQQKRRPKTMQRLYHTCLFFYFVTILIVTTLSYGVLKYYPQVPTYNICNDNVAWESLIDSLTSFKVTADFEILASISNPNYFDVALDLGQGTFTHNDAYVGTFEIPPVIVMGNAITDVLLLTNFSPDKWDALSLSTEYYRGKLLLNVNAQAVIRLPNFMNYTYRAKFTDLLVNVNQKADRNLCACPTWDI